jgi:hypothetical protein
MMDASTLDIVGLIDKLGGNTGFASSIGARHPSTASEMKRRGSIPVHYWPKVIAAAHERSLRLTADDLVRMHTARDRSQSEFAA